MSKVSLELSKSKMLDNIRSWNLMARKTCPGAVGATVCSGCYATHGSYNYGPTQKLRIRNESNWKNENWVNAMIKKISKMEYFRWFDSGDVYCKDLAEKIYQVILNTPTTKHWLPTRSYKIKTIKPILAKINTLNNVALRYSSDDLNEYSNIHGSVVMDDTFRDENVFDCPAMHIEPPRCNKCRVCWDKDVPVIGYMVRTTGATKIKNNVKYDGKDQLRALIDC